MSGKEPINDSRENTAKSELGIHIHIPEEERNLPIFHYGRFTHKKINGI